MNGDDSDGLPPLGDVIARLKLSARRSLGQNFLLDLNLTRRIARAAGDLAHATVVEVGPGPGGLTRALLMEGAGKVIAIERDERVAPALQDIARAYPGRVEIVVADALTVDIGNLAGGRCQIVANLPYNVATALLTRWMGGDDWPPAWTSATLLFQREVAERLTAKPGGKTYGRLSVLAQWRAEARRLFDIPPAAFVPRPKVTSTLVRIAPVKPPCPAPAMARLERVTAAAFGQRRKMVRQSLKRLGVDTGLLLARAGIAATARAEQLSVDDFVRLALLLDEG